VDQEIGRLIDNEKAVVFVDDKHECECELTEGREGYEGKRIVGGAPLVAPRRSRTLNMLWILGDDGRALQATPLHHD
jgi:hypothetical protein